MVGHQVSVDFIFNETAPMKDYLQAAGFKIEEAIERTRIKATWNIKVGVPTYLRENIKRI